MSDEHRSVERPDEHRRPPGATDETVAAVGKMTEALEWVERARGRLFDFHQMIGHADFMLDEAARLLAESGHPELADLVRTDVIGRNVLPGRWTFEVVEEFIRTYYEPFGQAEEQVRNTLLGGRRHVYESELKDKRRSPGRPGHERRPDE